MNSRKIWWVWLLLVVGLCLSSQDIAKAADQSETDAEDQGLTTNENFSCTILVYRQVRVYSVEEPIWVTIKLQHQLKQDLILGDDVRHSDVFSFHIEDKHGNKIPFREALTKNPALGYNRIEPGRIAEAMIDLADWYDLSEVGEYTVKAKWQLSAEGKLYRGELNSVNIKIVTKADKEIFDLISRATCMSSSGWSETVAKLKLVEMGDRVVAILLDWLEMEKREELRRVEPYMQHAVFDILSEIGAAEARKIVAESDIVIASDERIADSYKAHLLRQRDIWLKRIDIWQSDDRYNNLIKALDTFKVGKKWVIFKLGLLGDKRAIPVLEKTARQDKSLDIRETAKDALTHLKNPSIPMRYALHQASEKITLTASGKIYRIGEHIRINCKITGGQYGSHRLVGFSKPAWHFLPWGGMGADENRSQPFRFMMESKDWRRHRVPEELTYDDEYSRDRVPQATRKRRKKARIAEPPKGMNRFGRLIPIKELSQIKRRLINAKEEPLEDYIDLSELECEGGFALQPGESRHYTMEDLDSAFKITEPGEYEIYVYAPGKGRIHVSNTITITICP